MLGGAALANPAYFHSAARFAPPDLQNSSDVDMLYALTVRYGTCGIGEQWCLNATVTPPGEAKKYNVLYVTRTYLNPSTLTGPDPSELLPAVVLRLVRRSADANTLGKKMVLGQVIKRARTQIL